MLKPTHAHRAVCVLWIAAVGLLANPRAAQAAPRAQPTVSPEADSALAPSATPLTQTAPPTAASETVAPARSPLPMHLLSEAITLDAGATCLEHDRLVRRVARWLGREQVELPIRVEVRGRSAQPNSVSFVIVRGGDPRAERSISDGPADCDQLHSAVALSIALAIEATDANAATNDHAPQELPDDETLLAPPKAVEPRYFRLAFALFGQATSGVLTDVSAAGTARAEAGFVRWLDLRASMLLTAVAQQPIGEAVLSRANFSASLVVGRLDACPALAVASQLRIVACIGALAGEFRTVGHGTAIEAVKQASPWLGGAASFEAQAELVSRLALAASVDLVVPFVRRRIALQAPDGTPASRPRALLPVGVLVGVGLVLRVF